MMARRWTYAEFTADFPYDQVDSDRDVEIYGGRLASEAIADTLRRLGYDVGQPDHAYEHGWDFEARVAGRRIWLQVTRLPEDNYILITEPVLGFLQRLFGADLTHYTEFLTKLNDGLQRHPNFGPTKWYRIGMDWNPYGEPSADPLSVM